MRILLLNWRDIKNPKHGGAEIVTFEHAKEWVRKGYKVTWFTSGFEKAKKRESIDGIEIVRWGNQFTVYLLAPIYYFLNKNKIDFVVDEIHGFPFLTPLFVKKPKFAIIHEVADEIWDYMFSWPISKLGKMSEKHYFRFYKKVDFLVPSESTMSDLVSKGIPKRNINIFYCGANLYPLLKNEKEKAPTFIFVSRLVKMKGIQRVISAFEVIQRRMPDSKLWVVGDGESRDVAEFKKMAKSLQVENKVEFFGKVEESKKFNLLRRAHILLHASVKEGWGLVVIEAGSQKTPSVVYNVGGLRDSVKNNKTGIVLRHNSYEELARKAVDLYLNVKNYQKLQEGAYKWAKSLTWEKSTSASLSLITEVLKRKE